LVHATKLADKINGRDHYSETEETFIVEEQESGGLYEFATFRNSEKKKLPMVSTLYSTDILVSTHCDTGSFDLIQK
jgi:hypothetical protein